MDRVCRIVFDNAERREDGPGIYVRELEVEKERWAKLSTVRVLGAMTGARRVTAGM